MLIGDQFSVGGRQFSGKGDKISDFAVKAAASGNLALVEIKTPHTDLLEAKPYRGGLFGPDREITGAVNQILDQRFQLQRSLPIMKDASGIYDVESYAIQGLIIAGMIPTGRDNLKSFELFRNGLKSVSIVTYDEMLAKLEFLYEVFRGDSEQEVQSGAAATTDANGPEDEIDLELETDLEADIDPEADNESRF
ncbi:hypothetical protein AS026_05325 [Rhizobium altiplani]|uniref:Shedu protein SduA C-terminal domain-containing protein n=1 Tax=Rhizobium altiplani TaxID=1864509 RepID=A0A125Q7S7_9HYPH|nr:MULTISPECIES: Shedu immune nuclease family protein [Rhizobium]KWV51992.1 hypothetical protein AS026_05325 [Rhizobium altiplani]